MSVKYIQRKTALICPIHTAVKERASELLEQRGFFEKDEVIKALNFGTVSDAIRWDYIAEFLADEQGIELVPMAQRFFDTSKKVLRTKSVDILAAPSKFIAMGHGKKTMGYASVETHGGIFAVRVLTQRKALKNGVGEAYTNYLDKLRARNLLTSEGTPQIEN